MPRTYTLRRRADRQAETRLRIVEAAVDLHGGVGPAQTTFSMVAERAGVQRHTLYAHFPDERALQLACSALTLERDPLPDPGAWQASATPDARLRAGLGAIHGWYRRNAALAGCVLRDAEHHALTRETVELRMGPWMQAATEALAQGLTSGQRAMLPVAMGFFAWRGLTRDVGLSQDEAVATMVRAILAQP